MPRERKQVARFDPSPEAVASWNDTSRRIRAQVDLQARVRHGLASSETVATERAAAAAAAAAAASATTIAPERPPQRADAPPPPAVCRKPNAPAPGRKRQRTSAAEATAKPSFHEGPPCPPISDLRAGRLDASAASAPSSAFAEPRHPRPGSSVTDSSLSCSTSGSDSESSFSCSASVSSKHKLLWVHAPVDASLGRAGGSEGGRGERGGAVSVSGTDTDSEYCSDLLAPLPGSASPASCDSCSSCSLVKPLLSPERSTCAECIASSSGAGGLESRQRAPADVAKSVAIARSPRSDRSDAAGQCKPEPAPRNMVTLRIARSQMPQRWSTPPPVFKTCLDHVRTEDRLGGGVEDGAVFALSEEDGVDRTNWLGSGLIDVVMAKLARTYPDVHFMPIDFAVLCLNGWGSEAAPSSVSEPPPPPDSSAAAEGGHSMVFKDILGRPLVYSEERPVIFLTHVSNVHWNLLRVEHRPVPELQLFEPMGKPPRRQGASRSSHAAASSRGTGFRCIPKEVYRWLDTVWPLHLKEGGHSGVGSVNLTSKRKVHGSNSSKDGWASRAYSAITRQQQTTGFDCGVASLLYAEKCGQGQMREDVDAWTTQEDMTEYRRALQRYFQQVLPPATATATSVAQETSTTLQPSRASSGDEATNADNALLALSDGASLRSNPSPPGAVLEDPPGGAPHVRGTSALHTED